MRKSFQQNKEIENNVYRDINNEVINEDHSTIESKSSQVQQQLDQFEAKVKDDHILSSIRALSEKIKFYENIDEEKDIISE